MEAELNVLQPQLHEAIEESRKLMTEVGLAIMAIICMRDSTGLGYNMHTYGTNDIREKNNTLLGE